MVVKFNVQRVKSLIKQAEAGYYAAGNGLYLRVSNEGTGFWVVRHYS